MSIQDIFKVTEFKEAITKLENENFSLMENTSQLRDYIYKLQSENQYLKNSVSELQSENQYLKNSVSELQSENQYLKNSISELQRENQYLKNIVTAEQYKAINIGNTINHLYNQQEKLNENIQIKNNELMELEKSKQDIKSEIIELSDTALYQSFGLYEPKYRLVNTEEYKVELLEIRDKQKQMIKNNNAVFSGTKWTVNGSEKEGLKMTKDNIKQILRSFNVECETVMYKAKFNNYDSMKQKIEKSSETLNKLNNSNQLGISKEYLNLKIVELDLIMEYNLKLEEEKEEQRILREQEKEAKKLENEIKEAKKNIEKEQKHYKNALVQITNQLKTETNSEVIEVLIKQQENVKNNIDELQDSLEDVDDREANQRAGYVYVISNIGAFGENVYKIGMTRRLNPQDRIDELGSASVPFRFDVHAMIFSEDAPSLETALHRKFENRKINLVNNRKEFFYAKSDEIKECLRENISKSIEFIDIPNAEQYRESLLIRKSLYI